MIERNTRQRQQAEDAFKITRTLRNTRHRVFEEIDASKVVAEEKTSRLREARLIKEAGVKTEMIGKPERKRIRKL